MNHKIGITIKVQVLIHLKGCIMSEYFDNWSSPVIPSSFCLPGEEQEIFSKLLTNGDLSLCEILLTS